MYREKERYGSCVERNEWKMIQRLTRNKTILAIASIVIGVFMMIRRGAMVAGMLKIVGYLLIAAGAAYLIYYFVGKNREGVRLGYAAAAAVAGLVLVLKPHSVLSIFPIIAGAALVINGIGNLIQASSGDTAPSYSRIVAIVIIIIGALLIFRPFRIWDALVFIMGAALVLNGLADLDIIRRFW